MRPSTLIQRWPFTDEVVTAATPLGVDDSDSWWVGAQRCMVGVAIAGAAAALSLSSALAQGLQQQTDEIPTASTLALDDSTWQPPTVIVQRPNLGPIKGDVDELATFRPIDDDVWIPPNGPPVRVLGLLQGDVDEVPTWRPIEEEWQQPVGQTARSNALPLWALDELPTATFTPTEDESPALTTVLVSPVAIVWATDDAFALQGPPDDDYGYFPPIIPRYVPNVYAPIDADLLVPTLIVDPDATWSAPTFVPAKTQVADPTWEDSPLSWYIDEETWSAPIFVPAKLQVADPKWEDTQLAWTWDEEPRSAPIFVAARLQIPDPSWNDEVIVPQPNFTPTEEDWQAPFSITPKPVVALWIGDEERITTPTPGTYEDDSWTPQTSIVAPVVRLWFGDDETPTSTNPAFEDDAWFPRGSSVAPVVSVWSVPDEFSPILDEDYWQPLTSRAVLPQAAVFTDTDELPILTVDEETWQPTVSVTTPRAQVFTADDEIVPQTVALDEDYFQPRAYAVAPRVEVFSFNDDIVPQTVALDDGYNHPPQTVLVKPLVRVWNDQDERITVPAPIVNDDYWLVLQAYLVKPQGLAFGLSDDLGTAAQTIGGLQVWHETSNTYVWHVVPEEFVLHEVSTLKIT